MLGRTGSKGQIALGRDRRPRPHGALSYSRKASGIPLEAWQALADREVGFPPAVRRWLVKYRDYTNNRTSQSRQIFDRRPLMFGHGQSVDFEGC